MEEIEVKYKIIETHPDQHSIVVRYFTDVYDEDYLATSFSLDEKGNKIIDRNDDGSPIRCSTDVNINIWQTPTPNVGEIKKIASSYAPRERFKLQMAIDDANTDTSLEGTKVILNQVFVADPPPKPVVLSEKLNAVEMTENEIDQLIAQLTSELSANTSNT